MYKQFDKKVQILYIIYADSFGKKGVGYLHHERPHEIAKTLLDILNNKTSKQVVQKRLGNGSS